MPIETSVTVTARVVGEISSLATTVATSTAEVGMWQEIINWFMQII